MPSTQKGQIKILPLIYMTITPARITCWCYWHLLWIATPCIPPCMHEFFLSKTLLEFQGVYFLQNMRFQHNGWDLQARRWSDAEQSCTALYYWYTQAVRTLLQLQRWADCCFRTSIRYELKVRVVACKGNFILRRIEGFWDNSGQASEKKGSRFSIRTSGRHSHERVPW